MTLSLKRCGDYSFACSYSETLPVVVEIPAVQSSLHADNTGQLLSRLPMLRTLSLLSQMHDQAELHVQPYPTKYSAVWCDANSCGHRSVMVVND